MTEPTYLFLDTEWADAAGADLVSLALVSEDGQRVFYAERATLPAEATDFVRRVVYPLLERSQWALSDVELTAALRAFLAEVDEPYVLADYPNDLVLLKHALAGFNRPDAGMINDVSSPSLVMTCMDREGLTTRLLEDWFSSHPQEAAKRHHALVDAQALRMAWLAATGRIRADWARTNYLSAGAESSPDVRCRSIADNRGSMGDGVNSRRLIPEGSAMDSELQSELADHLLNDVLELLRTPAASRAILRTFFRISAAWELDAAEEATLLGELPAIIGAWRERPPDEPLPPATLERLSHLFGIYASLATLFHSPSRARAWLRRPNTAPLFGGDTALARMLHGHGDDLRAVREYLEAQFDH